MIEGRSASEAEAVLSRHGYKVRRYCDGGHEVVYATQTRQVHSTTLLEQEVKAAISFESDVFTDMIHEERFITKQ